MGFPVYRKSCFAKFVRINITWTYNHLIIFAIMANKTPSLKPLKMEELIELVRSNPGLYNQTKKIHKIWTRYVRQKISKKLDV